MDNDENDLEARLDHMLLESEESGDEIWLNDTGSHRDELFTSSEAEAEEDIEEEDVWSEVIQKPDRWPFTDTSGINYDAIAGCNEPIDFYRLYIDDKLINLIVNETNRYGYQKNPNWAPTTRHKLEKINGTKRVTRGRCSACYKTISQNSGAVQARSESKRVNTRCSNCKAYFCLECFQNKHKRC